jgi:hypothetical protein
MSRHAAEIPTRGEVNIFDDTAPVRVKNGRLNLPLTGHA